MLFTQQLFHLECLFFFRRILIHRIVIILDQITAWCCLEKCCLLKKHITFFFSLLKMKKKLNHMGLFLCLSQGQYNQKNVVKSRVFGKNINRWDGHMGRVAHVRGYLSHLHTMNSLHIGRSTLTLVFSDNVHDNSRPLYLVTYGTIFLKKNLAGRICGKCTKIGPETTIQDNIWNKME